MNEEQSPTNENLKKKTKEELQVIILNQSREIKNLRKQLDDRIEIGNLHTTNSKSSDKNKLEHFTTMKSKGKINDYPVLLDLWTNTSENKKEYLQQTIELANDIYLRSPTCHQLLEQSLNFPSKYIIDKKIGNAFQNLNEHFTDPDMSGEIISLWKKKNNVHTHLDACLGVDALFFHPEIIISDKIDIYGMEIPEKKQRKLPNNIVELFRENPRLFEIFIQENSKYVIRAAFVFQIQIYDCNFPTFVIHIKQAVSGKADKEIIKLLFYFENVCKNHNITIRNFAFDGDGGYQGLHEIFFQNYFTSLYNRSNAFDIHLHCQRIICDPSHLFKRLRYRLLSNLIHCGFFMNSKTIDVRKLRVVLFYLPSAVFRNDPISKMHDNLPILLFSVENFIRLYQKGMYYALAYFFPIVTAIIGMTNSNLTIECRKYFYESSFWFLIEYYNLFQLAKQIESDSMIKQKKSKINNDVMFYS